MKRFLLTVFVASLTLCHAHAQYGPNYNIVAEKGSVPYKFPWTGGLNNPQFSEADLNNDGTNDLVVFDRAGDRVLTFLNAGAAGYTYAPEFELNFPEMDSWCLLLDFNCDNIPDIFTHATLGIRVFEGYYETCGRLAFTLYAPLLYYDFNSTKQNLLVTNVDIPAIIDVNNDGDIDVLTFDPNGGYMWFYENVSQETGWGCDSLFFQKLDPCWGDFYEPASDNCKLLDQQCPFIPPLPGGNERGVRHTGSTTLAFDNTGDGIKEVLLGDISFKEVAYLLNDGTLLDAHVYDQDCAFPSYDVSAEVPYFPASYRIDADHDGVKDLVFGPNAEEGSNTLACAHFYKNTGSDNNGIFDYQTDSFLVVDMIDLGEGAAPAFFDYDADGLVDLLVSNLSYYDTSSFLATFRNVGSVTDPKFRLTKKNYANLAALNQRALRPTFGDLDGDGDQDMICGNEDGTLLYFTNGAAVGNPPQFSLTNSNYFGIDVGNYSAPQLYDMNGDGLLDLVIGKLSGKLSYYENHGSTSVADFSTLTTATFGNINAVPSALDGHSFPLMVALPGYSNPVLLVGNKQGELQLYDNVIGNLSGTFNLVTSNYSGIKIGKRSTVAAADINGDGVVELAMGHYRGGITLYDTASYNLLNPCLAINNISSDRHALRAFPNPTNDVLSLVLEHSFNANDLVETFDAVGRRVVINHDLKDDRTLQMRVENLADGIYTTRVVTSRGTSIVRWIKMDASR